MKTNRILALAVALLLPAAFTIPVFMTGCALFSPVAEGSRSEVVRAEQFAKISFALADNFMEWEHIHRASLGSDVKNFAAKLEREFPPAYQNFRTATKAYKAFPSSENLGALQRTRQVLQVLYDSLVLLAPKEVETRAAVDAKTLNLN